jgi:uncharacterized protein (DUF1800 family)
MVDTEGVNDREKIAWLYRRVGFGLAPGHLDALVAKGVASVLDDLVDPDAHGVVSAPDPWQGIEFAQYDPKNIRADAAKAVGAWLVAMASTPRPLTEWMRWFWHGHFVSTIRVVKVAELLVDQLRLFEPAGLGDFRTLLRGVTIDPAMLRYLDGVDNKKDNVNENYGRELLELFALGIGHYTEADVRAGATALTGWAIGKDPYSSRVVARQHDDSKQSYLGRSGVHDLDTVIDAVVAHDACATFITTKLARAILGPGFDQALVGRLAADFRDSGLQLRPLVRALLEAGLDGASAPLVTAPVPWFISAIRSTGAQPTVAVTAAAAGLVAAGQLPMDAPNVAGWPGGANWLSSSATVARFNLAAAVAELGAKDSPAVSAAGALDLAALATALGRPEGFGEATNAALTGLGKNNATGVLTVALASPEMVMA